LTASPLDIFHPLIRKWFAEKVGVPTEVQRLAWPAIASGEHVLATAPTGSGKTLAAFLWAIDRLATGAWERGRTSVLYVSPLRALNNDVRKNLLAPLAGIAEYFSMAGGVFPEVQVLTRSGDTPQSERRAMLRRPPEILITTPESLNILLLNDGGRRVISTVKTVILDEIHALAGSKRGTHCITAVEWMVPLCGEFRRVALSATVRPLEEVAAFAGGYELVAAAEGAEYRPRRVRIIEAPSEKRFEVSVEFPGEEERAREESGSIWPALVRRFREEILSHRSTLLFCNSRRLAEKVTRLVNEDGNGGLAYSHHGSLSREVRLRVEEMLKAGELRAIVATNTLELGIDIGELDRVVLVQSPFLVSSAIQRVGRAGHGVGGVSRGVIYPTHGMDLLCAAVLSRCLQARDLEEVHIIHSPLDVLAQVLLAMTAVEEWRVDDLYDRVRASHPYRGLPRRQFDLVLEMLAGRYAGTNVRGLSARVSYDRMEGTVRAMEGARGTLYLSGGTIPDRGYYDLRAGESRAKIGELDEEFVFERSVGDTFALGNQVWKIVDVSHNAVDVVPDREKPGIIPFWKAEERSRDFHLSSRLLEFLERADATLDDDSFMEELRGGCRLGDGAAEALRDFLTRQKIATGRELPHRHHVVIEEMRDPAGRDDAAQVVLHTLWGGAVNRPFAMALASALGERYGQRVEVLSDNDSIIAILPHGFDRGGILSLVTPENIETLIRKRLEETGFFGARFRENAGRALLLPSAGFNRRLPLWINRLRAKKLLAEVAGYDDFPVTLETWRTCLRDEFDLENLALLLEELRGGTIRVSEFVTLAPSPFAAGIAFRETAAHLYDDDTPAGGTRTASRKDLIAEIAGSRLLRPRIPEGVIALFEEKVRRLAPGYAPETPLALLEWVKERMIVPAGEWELLLAAARRDYGIGADDLAGPVAGKLASVVFPGATRRVICALEDLPRIAGACGTDARGLSPEPVLPGADIGTRLERLRVTPPSRDEETSFVRREDIIVRHLRHSGPVPPSELNELLGFPPIELGEMTAALEEEGLVVADAFRDGGSVEVCDRENLESLLRMLRKSGRKPFETLPARYLPLFVATVQGLARSGEGGEALKGRLEALFGHPAPVRAWEEYILPARIAGYRGNMLDGLFRESGLAWFGCGKEKCAFALLPKLELFSGGPPGGDADIDALLPDRRGRFGFPDMRRHAGVPTAEATERVWRAAWKGLISNDTFEALRAGIHAGFEAPDIAEDAPRRRGRASGFARWYHFQPFTGSWFALPWPPRPEDPVEELEIEKERVRLLLARYGIIFRELCDRELPPFRWGVLFRTLRVMELSGEVVAGRFFEGIGGPQFISREGLALLERGLDEELVYWMNAADPASLCGAGVEGLKETLPPRRATTYLVFHGARPVLVAAKSGGAVSIGIAPGELRDEHLALFRALTSRDFNPLPAARVETINGVRAATSPYADYFLGTGFRREYRGLALYREVSR